MDGTILESTERFSLPPQIADFAGVINDVDAHDVVPVQAWAEEFGPEMAPLRDACLSIAAQHLGEDTGEAGALAPTPVDDAPINAHNVWQQRDKR